MASAVRKTISLPPELAQEAEEMARAEGKTLSAFVQDALRTARRVRLQRDLRELQGFWSRTARERRLLSEEDLERYLAE
jgi:metal-responsive CopG/Arc/MetJ family transcriptional regulator